jgi:hypothetical protein
MVSLTVCIDLKTADSRTLLTLSFDFKLSDGTVPAFLARRAKMMGLYVSFIGNAARKTAAETMMMHHCVHSHDLYCATNPPTTGLTPQSAFAHTKSFSEFRGAGRSENIP